MINFERGMLSKVKSRLLQTDIYANCKADKGERPHDVIVFFRDNILVEPNFSQIHLDLDSKYLVPCLDVGKWKELTFVVGAVRVLVFSSGSGNLVSILNLNRELDSDAGWFNFSMHIHEDFLIMIHEGGLAAIAGDGKIIWQRQKYWDDSFDRIEDKNIVFVNDEGSFFGFACDTGDKVSID